MNQQSAGQNSSSELLSTSIPWNLEKLLARIDNDRAFLAELLVVFRQDSETALQDAKAALVRGDMAELERQAHTLKGMTRNLFMDRAAQLATDLEIASRQGQTDAAFDLFLRLHQEIEELFPQVDTHIAEVSA